MPPKALTVADPKLPQVIENVLKDSRGLILIRISVVVVEIQPFDAVPVIVNVKGMPVFIVNVLPTKPVGFQVYELAPDTVNVPTVLGQIEIVSVINKFKSIKSTEKVAVFAQPLTSFAATV